MEGDAVVTTTGPAQLCKTIGRRMFIATRRRVQSRKRCAVYPCREKSRETADAADGTQQKTITSVVGGSPDGGSRR